MNRRGSALVAVIVISLLLFGAALTTVQWITSRSKQAAHQRSGARALEYAESGVEAAQQLIRMPDALAGKTSEERTEEMPGGSVAYTLVADTVTLAGGSVSNILEVTATG